MSTHSALPSTSPTSELELESSDVLRIRNDAGVIDRAALYSALEDEVDDAEAYALPPDVIEALADARRHATHTSYHTVTRDPSDATAAISCDTLLRWKLEDAISTIRLHIAANTLPDWYVDLARELERTRELLAAEEQGREQFTFAIEAVHNAPWRTLFTLLQDFHVTLPGMCIGDALIAEEEILRALGRRFTPRRAELLWQRSMPNEDVGLLASDGTLNPLVAAHVDLSTTYDIAGWLARGEVGDIVADYGLGKTFLALDVLLSIAFGMPWRGRAVQQQPVMYLCYEAPVGALLRVAAWLAHHGILPREFTSAQLDAAIAGRFVFVRASALTIDDTEFVRRVKKTCDRYSIGVLCFDTYGKAIGSLKENDAETPHVVARALDQIGRTALLLKHTGLGDQTRARGSSAQPQDGDFTFVIKGDQADFEAGKPVKIYSTKRKNDSKPESQFFRIEPVDFVLDGKVHSSRVAVMAEAIEARSARTEPLRARLFRRILNEGSTGLTARGTRTVGGTGRDIDGEVEVLLQCGAIQDVGTEKARKYIAVAGYGIVDSEVVETDGLNLGSAVQEEV
jgi:hypothetical protein